MLFDKILQLKSFYSLQLHNHLDCPAVALTTLLQHNPQQNPNLVTHSYYQDIISFEDHDILLPLCSVGMALMVLLG